MPEVSLLSALVIVVALILAGYFAFSPRLAGSSRWRATVTPLASIMGSGFLVSAPLLGGAVGNLALFCMAALLVLAYWVGNAIRFNIRHFEPIEHSESGAAQTVAFLSRMVLAGAYFISVTYYLQLLSAFVGNAVGVSSVSLQHLFTTLLLLAIGGVGMWRGLKTLERLEKYAIALNLGTIGALLLALAVHNVQLTLQGGWSLPAVPMDIGVNDVRVLLGLLIVVQGFETSRYLGDEHSAEERIATMRLAQWLSGAIYLVFIGLITILFEPGLNADVTAIVRITAPIAMVLPILISVAAVGSQFSAAVADNSGAGGLLEDLTNHRLPVRYAYLLILLVTIALTWETHVNEIIAYASRAFALFYALQCAVAFLVAWKLAESHYRLRRLVGFAGLFLVCMLVFAFGLPAA